MQNTDKRIESSSIRKRDPLGLCEGITYTFKDDGLVDWRAMVNKEHIYPNEKYFTEKKKPVPSTIEGLDDKECLITLAGLKELLALRGYSSLDFQVLNDRDGIITTKCTIVFTPNFETDGLSVSRSDIATAGVFNVSPQYVAYSHTISANRAMARTIRSFLNIHVVSSEEIGDDSASSSESKKEVVVSPYSFLMNSINENSLSIEEVKKICDTHGIDSTWDSYESLKDKGSLARKIWAKLPKKV